MNHYTWTFVAGEGRNYNVGLFHSDKTGHLLIYIGSKIVTIDFRVFESKSYSFFIEDELCHIVLERKGNVMFYHFEVDKKADTPRNRVRHAIERRFTLQMLVAIGIFVAVIASFAIWNPFEKTKLSHAEELLMRQGRETAGTVLVKKNASVPEISYQFVANNQGFTVSSGIQSQPLILLKNGMPLESGDEFTVLYVPSEPKISRINFGKPTERQIQIYQKRAVEKHLSLHPGEAPSIAACMVNAAYLLNGISGIADIYFQDTTPESNPDHNQTTYLRLTHGLPFQKKVEKDCLQ